MYKNSIKSIIYPLVVAVAVVAGIFVGKVTSKRTVDGRRFSVSSNRMAENKLAYTLSLIEHRYVDPVVMDSLIEMAIPMVLGELDPHSVYLPARDFSDANEALEGEFDGIGVVFNMATDTVIVINVIRGGPSDRAGVLNGDRIIKINDSLVAGQDVDQNDIMKMLRGPRGTMVGLAIQRSGIESLVPVTVTRDKIFVKSVEAAYMIQPEIGFLKLSSFSKNSALEVEAALAELQGEGMQKLIFDLRGNAGGFLDQAIQIANMFLSADDLIVYTEDRDLTRREQYSDGRGKYAQTDIVVLIDEGSASSSEILAGALQDNDRGTVIGRRSYGKGLVQEQIPFRDGSALRLTVARYYTPTGRSIQKPYDKGKDAYGHEINDRISHNELFTADSIRFDDSLKFVTPGGKVVYGGGGIMPDIFIPYDTTKVSPYYIQAVGRNILYRYTIEYADKHRVKLNEIDTPAQLTRMLDSDTDLLDDFVRYAAGQGLAANWKDIAVSRPSLLARLRAFIGRNSMLDDVGFYSQWYVEDNEVLRAIEVLENATGQQQ